MRPFKGHDTAVGLSCLDIGEREEREEHRRDDEKFGICFGTGIGGTVPTACPCIQRCREPL